MPTAALRQGQTLGGLALAQGGLNPPQRNPNKLVNLGVAVSRKSGCRLTKAFPMCGRGPAQTEIGVNHLDILLAPSEVESTAAQVVLQPQALLIGQHLMRARLPNVDDGTPRQVALVDEF